MNTLQLLGMGVWLAITFHTTYTTLIFTVATIVRDTGVNLNLLVSVASTGWAGIILYYTFN